MAGCWIAKASRRTILNTLYANPPGTILPMGGDQAYKGFGLGLMVEIFAGALSGGTCIREVPINQNGNCVFMMVLDPGHLGGAEHFAREVAGLAEFVRGCPTIEGVSEILLPGEPERRTLAARRRGDSAGRRQLERAGQAGRTARSGAACLRRRPLSSRNEGTPTTVCISLDKHRMIMPVGRCRHFS